MNEELTNEVLEAIIDCDNRECTSCPARSVCVGIEPKLAAALLEERAKPKDDIWKYASIESDLAVLSYYVDGKLWGSKTYARELPKTRARQIAEKEGQGLAKKHGWSVAAGALVANVMEAALTKYAEELTNTKETE